MSVGCAFQVAEMVGWRTTRLLDLLYANILAVERGDQDGMSAAHQTYSSSPYGVVITLF